MKLYPEGYERMLLLSKKKLYVCKGRASKKEKKKRFSILGRTNVRFLMEIHHVALNLAHKTRARATNAVCFKSGTFEKGVAGEYCF